MHGLRVSCGRWLAPSLWSLCALGGLSPPARAAAQDTSDAFATCRAQFEQAPDTYEPAFCFYDVAVRERRGDEGARLFEELRGRHPDNAWLTLAYAHLQRTRDAEQAVALYRRAAERFRTTQHAEGEILSRTNLRSFLFPRGRVDEATREVARVVEIGKASSDPLTKARAWSLEATHVQDTGGDLALAYRLLRRTHAVVFPDGPYRLQRTCAIGLGAVAFRMGRLDEALALFREFDRRAAAAGDTSGEAIARYNILTTMAMQQSVLPTPGGREALLGVAESALAAALAAQHQDAALRTHRLIAELLTNEPGAAARALQHVGQCLAYATASQQWEEQAICSWVEASLLRDRAPAQARAAEARALAATARANSPRAQAYSASRHMRASWRSRPRPEAIRDVLAAIDTVELLRMLQDDAETGAELFSVWTLDHYWFSGTLLEDGHDDEIGLAFAITERVRARALSDALRQERPPLDPRDPLVARRRALFESIAAGQRALMAPGLDAEARRLGLARLEELELELQEAERQRTAASPRRRSNVPHVASLEAVQVALADDEALLSYQVGLRRTYEGDPGGGAWLTAVTRHQVSVHRLPDRVDLAPIVPVFAGLIEAGRGRDGEAGARLHADVVGKALARLPAGIDRLIVVPDGPLHGLPFDALRASPEAQPLGARYELVVVPSAGLWLEWRRQAGRVPTGRFLAVADPHLSDRARSSATRNATLYQTLTLGRLPHARDETAALRRHLGAVDVLMGPRASEHAVKGVDLPQYDLVHFAAHAIADQARPQRSAVVLAAGAASEDGLLQAREIRELDFSGRIVVLSACDTAAGAVLSGEGVLSLARAFFEAGAHAVIGTRWPIRDDEAARLFADVYRRLAEGRTMSDAIRQVKHDAIAAGRSSSAWAALVLLGNGDLRLQPQHRSTSHAGVLGTLAAASALVTLMALGYARMRRRLDRAPSS